MPNTRKQIDDFPSHPNTPLTRTLNIKKKGSSLQPVSIPIIFNCSGEGGVRVAREVVYPTSH
jgi:hypothetical protein